MTLVLYSNILSYSTLLVCPVHTVSISPSTKHTRTRTHTTVHSSAFLLAAPLHNLLRRAVRLSPQWRQRPTSTCRRPLVKLP
ncbi:hypothetical protein GGI35DRAFT_449593 [Trichoderma velutinum]